MEKSTATTHPSPPPSGRQTDAPASAPAVAEHDRATDCTAVLRELELDAASKRRGVNAGNIVPDSPEQRDANVKDMNRYAGAWSAIEARVTNHAVHDAAARYAVAIAKQRDVLVSLRYEPVPPSPPKPKPDPKTMTDEQLRRQAALDEAAKFALGGMLTTGGGAYLRNDDRQRFNAGRGDFLDAWEPLIKICEA